MARFTALLGLLSAVLALSNANVPSQPIQDVIGACCQAREDLRAAYVDKRIRGDQLNPLIANHAIKCHELARVKLQVLADPAAVAMEDFKALTEHSGAGLRFIVGVHQPAPRAKEPAPITTEEAFQSCLGRMTHVKQVKWLSKFTPRLLPFVKLFASAPWKTASLTSSGYVNRQGAFLALGDTLTQMMALQHCLSRVPTGQPGGVQLDFTPLPHRLTGILLEAKDRFADLFASVAELHRAIEKESSLARMIWKPEEFTNLCKVPAALTWGVLERTLMPILEKLSLLAPDQDLSTIIKLFWTLKAMFIHEESIRSRAAIKDYPEPPEYSHQIFYLRYLGTDAAVASSTKIVEKARENSEKGSLGLSKVVQQLRKAVPKLQLTPNGTLRGDGLKEQFAGPIPAFGTFCQTLREIRGSMTNDFVNVRLRAVHHRSTNLFTDQSVKDKYKTHLASMIELENIGLTLLKVLSRIPDNMTRQVLYCKVAGDLAWLMGYIDTILQSYSNLGQWWDPKEIPQRGAGNDDIPGVKFDSVEAMEY